MAEENTNKYEDFESNLFDEDEKIKSTASETNNINLPENLLEDLYEDHGSIYTNIVGEFLRNESNMDSSKVVENLAKHILDHTKADGISLMLYDDKVEGLRPFIDLKNSKLNIKDSEHIPIKQENLNSCKYKSHFNGILKKNELYDMLKKDNVIVDKTGYYSIYIIDLYNQFLGVMWLNYAENNYPQFDYDKYIKNICKDIAIIVKNKKLLEEMPIKNKRNIYTEEEMKRYLEVSADLVAIVGLDGYIKKLSSNWSDVLGWSEEELLSMPITDIIYSDDNKCFDRVRKLVNIDDVVTRNIIRYRHKNGDCIYLEWNSKYISEEKVYVTSAKDITQRIKMEKEKKELEKEIRLEIAKNESFSNISHEFRTPINILLGTTQVLEKNIQNKNIELNSLSKYTKYIKQNSYRLLRLVNNLIDINKIDMGAYELKCSNENIVNIIEDITQSVVEYTENNKINLIFDTDEEEVITYCDVDKIERIMLNLLSNAIKFTPEGGLIEVKINTTSEDVIVSIKDSGHGIPKEKLDLIFDRFGQANNSLNRICEGSGIGLAIVKELIEMHGGNINVKSKEGVGSEFIFKIPIKLNEKDYNNEHYIDKKSRHVEICNIEFSDIYSM
ncbi:ATP-binding protein [Terrisporobacter sp.]